MKNLKNMIYTAVFAALICVATMFSIKGPGGYYHIGDSFIYIAAVCLPFPYASIAGALGGSLADLLSGYAIWIIPTFIIKSVIALNFTNQSKILCKRNLFALLIAGAITVSGYCAAAFIILDFAAAVAEIYGNIAQAAVSAVIFITLSPAIPRIRKIIFKNNI
jgi:uncharacterized repeat protein (TIGR04002 family)